MKSVHLDSIGSSIVLHSDCHIIWADRTNGDAPQHICPRVSERATVLWVGDSRAMIAWVSTQDHKRNLEAAAVLTRVSGDEDNTLWELECIMGGEKSGWLGIPEDGTWCTFVVGP